MLKMHSDWTEAIKFNHFHAHIRKEALQTFRSISESNKKNLDDVLIVFWAKNVKPESQATAKHKWHKLTFDPHTKSLSDFLKELNECAERAFADNDQHLIDSLLYAKLPPHAKRSVNLAYLENAHTTKLLHTSKENGLENDGELTIPTMTAVLPNEHQQNTEQTKIVSHYCKKPGHIIRDCRKGMKKEQEQGKDSSIPNMKPSTSKSFAPCRQCQWTNHPAEKCSSGPNVANGPKRFKQDHPADNRNYGRVLGNLTDPGP